MKSIIIFFASIILVAFACENYCYGHGTCGSDDRCSCYPGWGGADCNSRACPYREAFVDVMLGDLSHDGQLSDEFVLTEWTPVQGYEETLGQTVKTTQRVHRYAECSNAGICDRALGECKCFDGFEGSACQRRYCPTGVANAICSGHGECLSSQQHIYDLGKTVTYTGWELEKFYKCKCDDGWEGIDCNQRSCPKGLDPVVSSPLPMFYQFYIETRNLGLESSETDKSLKCKDASGGTEYCIVKYDANGDPNKNSSLAINERVSYAETFRLKYTDGNGINYYSPTIKGRPGECPKHPTATKSLAETTVLANIESSVSSEYQEEIKRAIKRIPPLFQSNVTVECVQLVKDSTLDANTTQLKIDATKNQKSTGKYSTAIDVEYPRDLFVITTGSSATDANATEATSAYAISVKVQLEYGDISDYGVSELTVEEVMVKSKEVKSDQGTVTGSTTEKVNLVQKAYHQAATSITSVCSSRGLCNYDSGECQCFTGYYGMSCEKQRAISANNAASVST